MACEVQIATGGLQWIESRQQLFFFLTGGACYRLVVMYVHWFGPDLVFIWL